MEPARPDRQTDCPGFIIESSTSPYLPSSSLCSQSRSLIIIMLITRSVTGFRANNIFSRSVIAATRSSSTVSPAPVATPAVQADPQLRRSAIKLYKEVRILEPCRLGFS